MHNLPGSIQGNGKLYLGAELLKWVALDGVDG
jgi:hypothetical protein